MGLVDGFDAVQDQFKQLPLYHLDQDPTGLPYGGRLDLFSHVRAIMPRAQILVYRLTPDFVARLAPDDLTRAYVLHQPIDRELLKNPGFEETTGAQPADWSASGSPIVLSGASQAHSAERAVCTRGDGASGYTQTVDVEPDRPYELSEWITAPDRHDQMARVQLIWGDGNGGLISPELRVVPAVRGKWQQFRSVMVAPAGARQAIIYLAVHLNGRVCFDDLSFGPLTPRTSNANELPV